MRWRCVQRASSFTAAAAAAHAVGVALRSLAMLRAGSAAGLGRTSATSAYAPTPAAAVNLTNCWSSKRDADCTVAPAALLQRRGTRTAQTAADREHLTLSTLATVAAERR
eukprot:TRINITY_DN17121_c0_g1_i1.p2 TRINITY_DN17121_c0_g1~~TRINITY_DN17121_c0_g1_i1.p2  ORF type:complete len:110 (+),score=18.55 TRINITY_DN17121_c0_g1_i1:224-553(+)